MTVTRLTGGLTPGDANDPRTFPEIFNAAADVIDASEAGLSVVEGEVATLQDDVVELETRGFRIVDTLYFESNGTFTKADFPFLRAIRVKLQAGGGGSGAAVNLDRTSGAGGGGGFGEKFITNIAGMSASEAVTVGDGGSAGISGGTEDGGPGGASSFFGVQANGGGGGRASSGPFTFAAGGGTSGVDFGINGARGATRIGFQPLFAVYGGSAFLSPPDAIAAHTSATPGNAGIPFGGGGSQAFKTDATDRDGGPGASGIVILELFA